MCFFTASRLHRYYEPLRHPSPPGLSLTSCQLIHTAITAGTSRVATGPLCLHAVANTPAGRMEACSLVRFHRLRPSPNRRRVGPCITLFEACSAFTHVTACMLTESPMRPSPPKASAASLPPLLLRLLPGGTNQLPGGLSLPLRTSAFSRRTPISALPDGMRRPVSNGMRYAPNVRRARGTKKETGDEED